MTNISTCRTTDHPQLVQHLTAAVLDIEKVLLLGTSAVQRETRSIFCPQQATSLAIAHYYLLVLVGADSASNLHNLADTIESRLRHWIPVTAIVQPAATFANWLIQGHPFAGWVAEHAPIIYSVNDDKLTPATDLDEETVQTHNLQLLDDTKRKVQAFLAGAELYRIRKEYRLAAFMLHQAAEQQLRTMLVIRTGLRVNTHSLDRLMRYNTMWCNKLTDIFPSNNPHSARLFSLWQKAYIDARYNSSYAIGLKDLEQLEQKTKTLVDCLANEHHLRGTSAGSTTRWP